ncbi:phosphoadenylyl-sulfate reductase [Bacillus sp. FJAT-49732]|uniref:Adenosine 5'-phosphosulfate reductase n=1 Tax=Lederbergia citrisecunda TaxID=2833583 RepID=A0A942TRX2_9BACI|nr:phosphoadenylyl-sulfate reductase [Lederbergia citrisecunda]MBS4202408.1 phosphoadenylyl-sulfate reductase [Lederbergia citrisecunda]
MSDILSYHNWNEEKINHILQEYPDYMDIIKWAFQEYGDEIVYACSFGAEGVVLIDLISKVNPHATIIFLDTGLHFPETYELIETVKNRFPSLNIEMVKPKITVEEQTAMFGEELWSHNPNQCCNIRKVLPLQEALKDVKAWISGLRREQSPTRSNTQFINKDHKFSNIKICPLIHWTWDDILSYIQLNNLPYNPLHDQGYPSIGCWPCTSAVLNHVDLRSGRWAGTTKLECGLHPS